MEDEDLYHPPTESCHYCQGRGRPRPPAYKLRQESDDGSEVNLAWVCEYHLDQARRDKPNAVVTPMDAG